MTDDEARQEWNDVHALSGAYAVDALDDIERARFEEHLRGCPDCRTEVDSLRETAATLAVDLVAPPAGLRADVLAGIESIRPLPPLTPQPGDREPSPHKSPRRPWLSGTGPLLVAAALVLVALVTTVWLRPWADDEPAELTAAERVLAADDAREFSDRLPDGTEVTVVVSRSEGRAVLLTEDLAPAPRGKDYEMWLQTPGGALEPAGLVPDQGGDVVLLDGDPSEATGFGLSVEPDGGSPQPTEVVAFVDLPA
jgi:anti-sigma-K factor RskA